ncbi:MAG: sterol desaturase family protein, partial [Pseudomonadota bacterium]
VGGSYILFVWLQDTGSPLLFSSYLCVLVGGLGVLFHESFLPKRDDWRPARTDVASDSVFLVLVQIGMPFLLKAAALAVILALAKADLPTHGRYWPSEWPVLAQVALMLIVAEFFRYWLHRLMHEANPLWRLHAVHHASDKLYTVNVGRFHPLDKTLQFLGDTLPFLIVGVGGEVFAAYFVLYAVNGFYQHSNADVRLGPLNWIIAGPELHRWHHSAVVEEGHTNYGNNLIIWDVVFGTRFLPKGRSVQHIGIGNQRWPRTFLGQLTAPFTQPTEHNPR